MKPDRVIAGEILRAVQPMAIDAAMKAEELRDEQDAERRRALELELEQLRYEADLAARRYNVCDPDNRLVAAELEARWNTAIERVRECERRLHAAHEEPREAPDRAQLLRLADDLEAVWKAPETENGAK